MFQDTYSNRRSLPYIQFGVSPPQRALLGTCTVLSPETTNNGTEAIFIPKPITTKESRDRKSKHISYYNWVFSSGIHNSIKGSAIAVTSNPAAVYSRSKLHTISSFLCLKLSIVSSKLFLGFNSFIRLLIFQSGSKNQTRSTREMGRLHLTANAKDLRKTKPRNGGNCHNQSSTAPNKALELWMILRAHQ